MADKQPQVDKGKNEELAKKLLQKHGVLKAIRSEKDELFRLCAEYFYPNRDDLYGTESTGKKKGMRIYDGTPGSALRTWSDGMQGYLISRSIRWFVLKMSTENLNEHPEVKQWLQELESILYACAIRNKLYSQITPFFDDGGWHGSPTMFSEVDDAKKRIIFTNGDPNFVWFSTDKYNEVDTWHRELKLTARNALDKFGPDNVSDKILQAVESGKGETEFEYLHCIYPNDKRDVTKIDAKNMPWASVYVEVSDNRVARQSGHRIKPAATWRVRKYGKGYGISPAQDALVEALKLNTFAKDNQHASHLMVSPSYNVPQELRGKASVLPGKYNYYGEDPNRLISAIQSGIQLPAGIEQQQRVQEAIERHFSVDFFLMLAHSERQKTAYEIMQLQGEKAILMGPKVGTFNEDYSDWSIDRMFHAEMEFGNLPPMPAVLEDYQGGEIDIDYVGPLAQAQKKLFASQGISEGLESMKPVFEMFPSAIAKIKPEILIDEIAAATNFTQKAVVENEEYYAAMAQEQQMQQAMAQAEMAEKAASAVPKLQGKTQAGSPMETLAEAI